LDTSIEDRQTFEITIGTGNLDSLAITSATYNTGRSQLFVSATDPNAYAVLTCSSVATNGIRQPVLPVAPSRKLGCATRV
jgi:hypothetical protein